MNHVKKLINKDVKKKKKAQFIQIPAHFATVNYSSISFTFVPPIVTVCRRRRRPSSRPEGSRSAVEWQLLATSIIVIFDT